MLIMIANETDLESHKSIDKDGSKNKPEFQALK